MRIDRTDPDVRVGIVGLENGDFSRTVTEDDKMGRKVYVMLYTKKNTA
jgi:hypothetical protein